MKITLDIPQEELAKLISPLVAEPRILLHGVTWEQYEAMIAAVGSRSRLRMTYIERTLEIMTISPEHEMIKTMIARLIYVYADEMNINVFSCGSATFRKEAAARGLEPDESYCIGTRKNTPDLAIEIVIISGGIDKLEVYKGLQVSEVWFWQEGKFLLYSMHGAVSDYESINRSKLFPDLDLELLADYIKPDEEPQAARAFRNAIRRSQSHQEN